MLSQLEKFGLFLSHTVSMALFHNCVKYEHLHAGP